ncbi:MAG: FliM/FliN family flagellar motor switch protein [Magnetovibrio sp.]|nr:FliM/FliN family flagellar motor switch protein [Magnetovibrio sp.]
MVDNIDIENDEEHKTLLDVEVVITAVLGTTTMKVNQLLKMGRGAVVMLDRGVSENIEVKAEGNLVALGEVVVVEDRLAVTITKIYKSNMTM